MFNFLERLDRIVTCCWDNVKELDPDVAEIPGEGDPFGRVTEGEDLDTGLTSVSAGVLGIGRPFAVIDRFIYLRRTA
jgi:hypothetical protein